MKRAIRIFLMLITVFLVPADRTWEQVTQRKPLVTKEQTAIRIAEAALAEAYGEEQLKADMPLKAKLERGVWTVEGSFPQGFYKGGIALVSITEEGCILSVTHGK
ncbi:MAG TPA: NTF2 fold immunity protein [Candidatus Acidoferrum sp.]|nr:NTF2 fold immunity protein [Candidatus Acidoferrum sp.]